MHFLSVRLEYLCQKGACRDTHSPLRVVIRRNKSNMFNLRHFLLQNMRNTLSAYLDSLLFHQHVLSRLKTLLYFINNGRHYPKTQESVYVLDFHNIMLQIRSYNTIELAMKVLLVSVAALIIK